MTPFVLLPLLLLLRMLGQVYVPWADRPRGAVVHRESLTLLGRLRLFGRAASAGLLLVAVGARLGWLALPLALGFGLAFLAVPMLPVRYTLTTQGISLGHAPFRRWTEFGGVARRPGGVRLGGVAGARGMTVWLSGRHHDDDFVLLLRQLVRGSYKGQVEPNDLAAPGERRAPRPAGAPEPVPAPTS